MESGIEAHPKQQQQPTATEVQTVQVSGSEPLAGSDRLPKFYAYASCIDTDIVNLVKTREIDFAKELDMTIGPVNSYRFSNGIVRIDCKSAEQLEVLLSIKEFLQRPVTLTRPWAGSEKATKRADDNKPVRYNKIVVTGVSEQWTDEDLKEELDADYVRRINKRIDGELRPTPVQSSWASHANRRRTSSSGTDSTGPGRTSPNRSNAIAA